MFAFQHNQIQTDHKMTVDTLIEIKRRICFSQRGLISNLTVSLDLINQYLNHFLTRVWFETCRISSHHILCIFARQGFKIHMIKRYLAQSLIFFRDAKSEFETGLSHCKTKFWSKIPLVGKRDSGYSAKPIESGTEFWINFVATKVNRQCSNCIVTGVINFQGTQNIIGHRIRNHLLLALNRLYISKGDV